MGRSTVLDARRAANKRLVPARRDQEYVLGFEIRRTPDGGRASCRYGPVVETLTQPMALEAASTDAPSTSVASALVERARNGDESGFEMLLRDRLDRLFQTACVILG